MTDSLLLRSQKNEVFLAIQRAGLEPAGFDWQRWESINTIDSIVSGLFHSATGDYFLFDILRGEHWCRYSPGEDKAIGENYPGSWSMQMDYVRKWLANIKREASAVDLWETLATERALGESASSANLEENESFTNEERRRITGSIQEIRAYIASTITTNDDTLGSISDRLDYLRGASERLGRKDWLNVAFSVIANIAVGAAFAPDAARNLLHFVGAALSWIIVGAPVLPNLRH